MPLCVRNKREKTHHKISSCFFSLFLIFFLSSAWKKNKTTVLLIQGYKFHIIQHQWSEKCIFKNVHQKNHYQSIKINFEYIILTDWSLISLEIRDFYHVLCVYFVTFFLSNPHSIQHLQMYVTYFNFNVCFYFIYKRQHIHLKLGFICVAVSKIFTWKCF